MMERLVEWFRAWLPESVPREEINNAKSDVADERERWAETLETTATQLGVVGHEKELTEGLDGIQETIEPKRCVGNGQ